MGPLEQTTTHIFAGAVLLVLTCSLDDRAILIQQGESPDSTGGRDTEYANGGNTLGGSAETGGVSPDSRSSGGLSANGSGGHDGSGALADGRNPAQVGGASQAGLDSSESGNPGGGRSQGGGTSQAGAPTGGSHSSEGSIATSDASSGGKDPGANSDAGGEGGTHGKPQCAAAAQPLRTTWVEDFESYSAGPPYEQTSSTWIQAATGYDGRIIESAWAHSASRSYMLRSYTTKSEIAYRKIDFRGSPRRVDIDLWYTPNGAFVYGDFAEFGLGFVSSEFAIAPTVAFEVNYHELESRAAPENPVASSNGAGPYPPPVKPPAEILFHEVVYADCSVGSEPPNCAPKHNYIRIELDFCADSVRAFVGADTNAPLVGQATFDGAKALNAFYLAGGLNPTYVDDIAVRIDD